MDYVAIVHKDQGSAYGVSFPDFPGCITCGDTLEEAKNLAIEALRLHIDGLREDGETAPPPSSLDHITALPEAREATAFILVPLPEIAPRTVRINISIPEPDLRTIDRTARNLKLSRSAYLTLAARKTMADGESALLQWLTQEKA